MLATNVNMMFSVGRQICELVIFPEFSSQRRAISMYFHSNTLQVFIQLPPPIFRFLSSQSHRESQIRHGREDGKGSSRELIWTSQ